MCDGSDLFLAILAILFPPIAVWVKRGICSGDSLINIALCLLGYIPGLFHAWYIISSYPDFGYEPVIDEERVHVYYVQGGPPPPSAGPGPGAHTTPQAGYGTIAQPKYAPQDGGPGNTDGSTSRGQQQRPASQASPKSRPQATGHENGEGSSDAAPPPSYAEVVRGDNKVQTQD